MGITKMAAQITKTVSRCIFCQIIAGTSPASLVHQDEKYIAFNDIKPASENHFLVIPKEHIDNTKSLSLNQVYIVNEMVAVATELVMKNGGDLSDCRMGFHWPPFNSISHLHLHVIFPASKMGFIGRIIFRPDTFYFA